jgi:hypothetical protein
MYELISRGQPTRVGSPAWGFGDVPTTPRHRTGLVKKQIHVREP